jgi:hypothetical protein
MVSDSRDRDFADTTTGARARTRCTQDASETWEQMKRSTDILCMGDGHFGCRLAEAPNRDIQAPENLQLASSSATGMIKF